MNQKQRKNSTFRKHKVGNFTVIDNNIFKNRAMTLKAKGLLALMLSLPDDWEYSERGLVAISKDGRSSVRSGLKELEEHGYLARVQLRDKIGGFVSMQYNVYEVPQPLSEKPKSQYPLSENPTSGNVPNKELSNKELSNKELKNKYIVRFEEFYNLYPKKIARQRAETAFKNAVKDLETLKLILNDLEKRKGHEQWYKDEGKYIPHPATYLNGAMWLDEYEIKEVDNHEKVRRDYANIKPKD